MRFRANLHKMCLSDSYILLYLIFIYDFAMFTSVLPIPIYMYTYMYVRTNVTNNREPIHPKRFYFTLVRRIHNNNTRDSIV